MLMSVSAHILCPIQNIQKLKNLYSIELGYIFNLVLFEHDVTDVLYAYFVFLLVCSDYMFVSV